MPDVLEELALSGVLFETDGPSSRPHSPVSRTPSPSTSDELFGGQSREGSPEPTPDADVPSESIGMGPGRTGVKGVIRDRNEARERDRVRRETELPEMQKALEKSSLTAGKTYLEEEEERKRERRANDEKLSDDDEEDESGIGGGWSSRDRRKGRTNILFGSNKSAYGYLREVGSEGFVQAVEQVERSVWVVVHLYDPVRAFLSPVCSSLVLALFTLAASAQATELNSKSSLISDTNWPFSRTNYHSF